MVIAAENPDRIINIVGVNGVSFFYQPVELFENVLSQARSNGIPLNKYLAAPCVHGDLRGLGDSHQIAVVLPKQLPGRVDIRKINRDLSIV